MDIPVEHVEKLGYERITNKPIRDAVAHLHATNNARHEAKLDVIELEQERPQAEWQDAEQAEQARAEGKPEPKRSAVAAHDRKLDQARHEEKVAELALQRAQKALSDALAQHGDAWRDEVRDSVEALNAEWQRDVSELIALHGRLETALMVAHVVIGKQPQVGALCFPPKSIRGLDLAAPQPKGAHGVITTPDVLAALHELATPEPDVEQEPQQHRPPVMPGNSPTRGQRDVEDEIAERERFLERARDPKRVAERRQRSERLRAENEAAQTAGS